MMFSNWKSLKSFYGRERIGESNYHDSQGEFWPKLKQCLTGWTKEALPQSFRTRAFWLFPAFVFRHFLSHCCATSSRSLSDRELSAGEVPLDLAEFCHVVALAPLHEDTWSYANLFAIKIMLIDLVAWPMLRLIACALDQLTQENYLEKNC